VEIAGFHKSTCRPSKVGAPHCRTEEGAKLAFNGKTWRGTAKGAQRDLSMIVAGKSRQRSLLFPTFSTSCALRFVRYPCTLPIRAFQYVGCRSRTLCDLHQRLPRYRQQLSGTVYTLLRLKVLHASTAGWQSENHADMIRYKSSQCSIATIAATSRMWPHVAPRSAYAPIFVW